ncbi:MAG TPA: DUF4398 domain-containing protein [Geminicoccus sp.]|nr:DUF4398 domain-containing protein [Geminicoccus sp.]
MSIAGATLLLLGACASTPPPDDAMAAAKLALQRAEASEAPSEAPLELQQARDKLAEAEQAIADEDYRQARRLAQEAAADAGLAEAQAERAVAERNRQQVDSAIDALAPGGSVVTTPALSNGAAPAAATTPLAPAASGGIQ